MKEKTFIAPEVQIEQKATARNHVVCTPQQHSHDNRLSTNTRQPGRAHDTRTLVADGVDSVRQALLRRIDPKVIQKESKNGRVATAGVCSKRSAKDESRNSCKPRYVCLAHMYASLQRLQRTQQTKTPTISSIQ